jgi:hypothetical protein
MRVRFLELVPYQLLQVFPVENGLMIYRSGFINTPAEPFGAQILTKKALDGIISIALLAATFARTVGNNRSGETDVAAFGSVFTSKNSSQLVSANNSAVDIIIALNNFIINSYLYD